MKVNVLPFVILISIITGSYVSFSQNKGIYNGGGGAYAYNNGNFILNRPMGNDLNILSFDTSAIINYKKNWSSSSHNEHLKNVFTVNENGQDYLLWTGVSSGFVINPPFNPQLIYVVKTNLQGDTLWTHVYGWITGNSISAYFCLANDSNYLFSIYDGHGTIIKADRNTGDTLWTKHNIYQPLGNEITNTSGEIVNPGNAYYITGNAYPYTGAPNAWANFKLMKTDTLGNALWMKAYGDTTANICWASAHCHDGGFIMVGTSAPQAQFTVDTLWYNDFLAVRTNANGDTLWCMRYDHDSLIDRAYGVVETPDHGFALIGTTDSLVSSTNSHAKAMLLKIDSLGNVLWAKTFDPYPNINGMTSGQIVKITDKDGFMFSGGGLMFVTDSLGNNCLAQSASVIASHPQMHITSLLTTPSQGLDYSFRTNTQQNTPTGTVSIFCSSQAFSEVTANENEVSVYPNPAKDKITISSQLFGDNVQIEISDITGREILSQKKLTVNCKLKTANLTPGIYFVKVTTDRGSVVRKFIRQ